MSAGYANRRPLGVVFLYGVLLLTALLLVACGGRQGGRGRAQAMPAPQGEVTAAEGERVFQTMGCSACHLSNGRGPGPSLAGIYGHTVTLKDGATVTADEEYIRRSILDPSAQIVEGYQPLMPSFEGRLDERELSALVAYIRSLE